MPRSFFDTSALVKHDHAEAGSDLVDRLIGEIGAEVCIARLTLVETISVFAIKVRTGEFDAAEFSRLRILYSTHVARRRYQVVSLLNVHYDQARNLIADHGLRRPARTLDKLQLSAVIPLRQVAPITRFVCADQRRCDLASFEGLTVLNPEHP